MASSDLRQFLRVAAEVDAEAVAAGGTRRGSTRDLSLKGMFLRVAEPFPEGSTCRILLLLDVSAPGLAVHANGYVTRTTGEGMAIEFTDIIGLDSWDHLRSVILLNAEDPHRAQEQFASHTGLRKNLLSPSSQESSN